MNHRTLILTAVLGLALAAPSLAQEAPEPPPGVERLERVRLERMQHALELSEEQMAELHGQMEAHRAEMHAAMEAHHEAMAALRSELQKEPVDQEAVRRALERAEGQREAMTALRQRHHEGVTAPLTPEQQARMMFFSREFDGRLRELIAKHRAPGMERHMAPGMERRPAPGMERRPAPGMERRRAPEGLDRQERIERLRHAIAEMQQRLAELEAQEDE